MLGDVEKYQYHATHAEKYLEEHPYERPDNLADALFRAKTHIERRTVRIRI